MRSLALALTPLLSLACASAHPVPRTVTGYAGVGGMSNTSLARTTATNRAIAAASALRGPDAVSFDYTAAGGGSALTLVQVGEPIKGASTRLIEVSLGSWVGVTKLDRSDAAVAAIEALPCVEVTEEVELPNVGKAIEVARSRAIRRLVAGAIDPTGAFEGHATGTVTLADMVVDVSAHVTGQGPELKATHEVRVSLWGAAKVEARAPLAEAARGEALRAVVRGERALEDLGRALSAMVAARALAPDEPSLMAEHAALLDEAGEPAESVALFEQVLSREPTNLDYLQLALGATAKLGDPEKIAALEQRVSAVVAAKQAAAAEVAAKQAAADELAAAEAAAAAKRAAEVAAADAAKRAAEEAAQKASRSKKRR